tara:strand:+ start:1409 stop:1672 length:264 start_codon:yes stop_codon:yes gene_type:complete
MKLFFYKSILIFFLFIAAIHFSFGLIKNELKREYNKVISKENSEQIKNKIREEMRNAIKKENYLDKEDAILINQFIEKIKSELSRSK